MVLWRWNVLCFLLQWRNWQWGSVVSSVRGWCVWHLCPQSVGLRPFERVWFGSGIGHHFGRGWSCRRLAFLPLDVKCQFYPLEFFGVNETPPVFASTGIYQVSPFSQIMPGPDWRKGRRLEEEARLIVLVHEALWLGLRKGTRRMFVSKVLVWASPLEKNKKLLGPHSLKSLEQNSHCNRLEVK